MILVRTYPAPSQKDVEVSCTAGVTASGEWIRLFPVPYRFIDLDKRFRKYQEIECLVHKASDSRPESHRLNIDSIRILGEPLPTTDRWAVRRQRVEALEVHCMCCIQKRRDNKGSPTLGFFAPHEIAKLTIEKTTPQWSDEQLAKLRQHTLWQHAPTAELVKVPYTFKYHFRCPHNDCNGHAQSCTDWEIAQAYLKWQRKYDEDWEAKFRQRFEDEMLHKNDTKFFVGTLRNHPSSWQIVGLWYPKKANGKQLSLL